MRCREIPISPQRVAVLFRYRQKVAVRVRGLFTRVRGRFARVRGRFARVRRDFARVHENLNYSFSSARAKCFLINLNRTNIQRSSDVLGARASRPQ